MAGPSAQDVAPMTGWNQICQIVVPRVPVKVVYGQNALSGSGAPLQWRPTPMARMAANPDVIEKDSAVLHDGSVSIGQRVVRRINTAI